MLYKDLVSKNLKASQTKDIASSNSQRDFNLLNAFEMLWNIENDQKQSNSETKESYTSESKS